MLQEVEAPILLRHKGNRRRKVISLTRRPLFTPQVSFLRFLVLISVRGWIDPRAIVRPEILGKSEKIHLIGTWTRDLPACGIVSQPLRYRVPRTYEGLICFDAFSVGLYISSLCKQEMPSNGAHGTTVSDAGDVTTSKSDFSSERRLVDLWAVYLYWIHNHITIESTSDVDAAVDRSPVGRSDSHAWERLLTTGSCGSHIAQPSCGGGRHHSHLWHH
jgi:hypothetical protein